MIRAATIDARIACRAGSRARHHVGAPREHDHRHERERDAERQHDLGGTSASVASTPTASTTRRAPS
jgi:hypothetical protein